MMSAYSFTTTFLVEIIILPNRVHSVYTGTCVNNFHIIMASNYFVETIKKTMKKPLYYVIIYLFYFFTFFY